MKRREYPKRRDRPTSSEPRPARSVQVDHAVALVNCPLVRLGGIGDGASFAEDSRTASRILDRVIPQIDANKARRQVTQSQTYPRPDARAWSYLAETIPSLPPARDGPKSMGEPVPPPSATSPTAISDSAGHPAASCSGPPNDWRHVPLALMGCTHLLMAWMSWKFCR